MTLKFLLCLYSLVSTVQLCRAQAPQSQNKETRTVDFRTLALESGIETNLYYNDGEDFALLTVSHYRPSSVVTGRCGENGNLLLFKKAETSEGTETFQPYRQVQLPNGSEQVLLLLAQKEANVGIIAIKDNLSSNDKDWLFLNATSTPLVIQLGDKTKAFTVAAGQSLPYRIQLESGQGVPIQIVVFKKEQWKRVYSTYWPLYEGQRCLVICVEVDEKIKVLNFFEPIQTAEEETDG